MYYHAYDPWDMIILLKSGERMCSLFKLSFNVYIYSTSQKKFPYVPRSLIIVA